MNSPLDHTLTQLQLAREAVDQVREHLALAGVEVEASLASGGPGLAVVAVATAFHQTDGLIAAIDVASESLRRRVGRLATAAPTGEGGSEP